MDTDDVSSNFSIIQKWAQQCIHPPHAISKKFDIFIQVFMIKNVHHCHLDQIPKSINNFDQFFMQDCGYLNISL